MGTISERKRRDGSIGYTAQIRRKQGGVIVYTEAKTFDRAPAARAWLAKREKELDQPGALESAEQENPLLSEVIDRYIRESVQPLRRTKQQALNKRPRQHALQSDCQPALCQLRSKPEGAAQTVGNYFAHLSAVVLVARPAWGYPLHTSELSDARIVLRKLGYTSKSKQRDRRPTLGELDRIMEYYSIPPSRGPKRTIPSSAIHVCARSWHGSVISGHARATSRALSAPAKNRHSSRYPA